MRHRSTESEIFPSLGVFTQPRDLLGAFMYAHSTLAPSNDPQNDSNNEKSCGNKIKGPIGYLNPIDTHAAENNEGVAAGPDGRQLPANAEPDSQ